MQQNHLEYGKSCDQKCLKRWHQMTYSNSNNRKVTEQNCKVSSIEGIRKGWNPNNPSDVDLKLFSSSFFKHSITTLSSRLSNLYPTDEVIEWKRSEVAMKLFREKCWLSTIKAPEGPVNLWAVQLLLISVTWIWFPSSQLLWWSSARNSIIIIKLYLVKL